MAHRAYFAISLVLDEEYQEEMILSALSDYVRSRYELCDAKVICVGSLPLSKTKPISSALVDVT